MEWTTQKLGDFCEVIAGQSPEGKYYNDTGDGLPFYQGKKEFQKTNIGPPQKWTTKVTKEAKAGDILMSVRAPVGPINFSTQSICIGRGLAAIRPSGEIDRSFLFYYLLSKQDEIKGSEGAVFASINKSQIESLQFPYVNIDEQKRIVAILDQVFADIEKARATAETNLKNARELFDSYLQEVFSHRSEGCVDVKLSEITQSISDGDHSAPPKSESGIPFITISNINKSTKEIDFSNTFKVPKEYFDSLKNNRKPTSGDILYTVTGSYGIPVHIKDDRDFCFQRHIGLVRPNEDVDSTWLYFLLMSPQVFAQADKGATGTAQKTVSLKLLRSIIVPKVPYSLQLEIAKEVVLLQEKSKRLEETYLCKLNALDELKKSILQKAFTGELSKSKGAVA